MLGKLIKMEFKSSGRLIPLIYLVVILLAVAGFVTGLTQMYIYFAISAGLLFLAGAAALIITYVVVFMRFHKSMFGAEGYLANTLPVTTGQLYLSKTIVSFCWLLLSFFVTMGAWISAVYAGVRMLGDIPDYILEEMQQELSGILPPSYFVFLAVSVLVGFMAFLGQVYFCITLSNCKPFNGLGIGGAVIAYVVLSIVTQIISTAMMMYVPLSITFNGESWRLSTITMWDSMRYMSGYNVTMGISSYIFSLFYAFGLPFITINLLKKRVTIK